jgi:Putative amidoligase enzyme
MNTQVTAILAQNTTKTAKMEQLLLLGLSRTQVAELTGGNYGFVQNVFAKMRTQGRIGNTLFTYTPTAFDRKFGVEIECYGVQEQNLLNALTAAGISVIIESRSQRRPNAWKITGDSSINGELALELVSPILQGEDGLAQLRKVSAVLVSLRAKINKSCGTHIHFDAASFTLTQWKNLLLNYAGFENIIDSMMPASRRADNNTYCKSMKNISQFETIIKNATSLTKIKDHIGSRYYKINLEAFGKFGSVEFRQHGGTIEFEKLENWIQLLHNLVEFSKTKTAESFTFTSLSTLLPESVTNFYHQRIQDLAA